MMVFELPSSPAKLASDPPGLASFVRLVEIAAEKTKCGPDLVKSTMDLWCGYVEGTNRIAFGPILEDER